MKINPFIAINNENDYDVFSNMIITYLDLAYSNNTPISQINRAIRELLSMMNKVMPEESKYYEYISSQYWTEKALQYADFSLPSQAKVKNKIEKGLREEANNMGLNVKSNTMLILEHLVPMKILSKNIIDLYENKQPIKEYIKENLVFITCTRIEDKILNENGYNHIMPNENNKWSRYQESNIKVFDTLTGKRVV